MDNDPRRAMTSKLLLLFGAVNVWYQLRSLGEIRRMQVHSIHKDEYLAAFLVYG